MRDHQRTSSVMWPAASKSTWKLFRCKKKDVSTKYSYWVNNFVITVRFISIQVLGLTAVSRNYIKLLDQKHW